jgi:hypothetical protein
MELSGFPHQRLNPLTGRWILVSPQRTQRPWLGKVEERPSEATLPYDPSCYLCPGNARAGNACNPQYSSTFVFDNDYPALLQDTPQCEIDESGLIVARSEQGLCRVICFSPRHDLTIPRLSPDELILLAAEIREFIVDAVTRTGGHLGSNLGVVELTLALHRTFDSPRDLLLWDTGHQAYVHKLVTGRRDQFSHLRQEDGLSGYPSRTESEHDWVENSHASTALSYAYGLANARRLGAELDDGAGWGPAAAATILTTSWKTLPPHT